MGTAVRILHLEDDPDDRELVRQALAKEGMACEPVHVETHGDFLAALKQTGWDIILADYTLPTYDGLSALRLARELCSEVPFIFVTGTIGEDAAIESLKAGATDYVLKHHLTRLAHAVRRALREVEERKERKLADEDRVRLEEQLRQAQKMEAIGRLAGGIAHDFNNLLTAITGYSELVLDSLGSNLRARKYVEQITKAGWRAATLTRQLLAFSRRQVQQLKVLDLNAVVTNFEAMLHPLIGEDIQLETVLQARLGLVKADPGQIEQIILNLTVNARDAMPEGGKLTVETANVELDEAYARRRVSVRPGPYVMLAFSDSGSGMDAETQARIFEPFFTTKERGKGTGLGLATVYGIVKQSGGNIWVYSEPGKGTTFKIYLPQVEGVAEGSEPALPRSSILRGSETILLVEDEEMVRTLAREILEAHGYTVSEARDSTEALRICHMHSGSIHLLVTDVVMPGLSGRELAARLGPIHPETKVLYMSGYTDDAVVRHGVLNAGLAFLQKPFSGNAFLRKVREVLDSKSSPTVYGRMMASSE
jgi:two-component system cell cycle sensor histidine kinase/response regulator CckA